jgi:hypothetical protein
MLTDSQDARHVVRLFARDPFAEIIERDDGMFSISPVPL